MPPSDAENLVRATQHALDDLNDFPAHHLRLRLAATQNYQRDHGQGSTGSDEADISTSKDSALTVTLRPSENVAAPESELHQYSERLDITYPTNQAQSQPTAHLPLVAFLASELQKLFSEEKITIEYVLSNSNMLGPNIRPSITGGLAASGSHSVSPNNNNQPRSAAMKSVAPQLMDAIARRSTRSLKYAETYHLSFSLLTPEGRPSSWDIESALQEHLMPLLKAYSPISNFSIDTQVQPYATFSPTAAQPEYDESHGAWTLKQEDLSGFINAAEWPLSPSIGGGPTINFILYVPDASESPLVIKENSATSWLIPQWGGLVLLNPKLLSGPRNPAHLDQEVLRPALTTFSHQLVSLLGMPSNPSSLPLRLQSLMRIHTASLFLSASSTMGSLARLTRSLSSIPIPLTVATSVSRTLSHLSDTCTHLRNGHFQEALVAARIAEHEAERSFFEKSMVGQAYFPDEHKVAVYLPLLGPIGVPLVLALVKEIRRLVVAWRSKIAG